MKLECQKLFPGIVPLLREEKNDIDIYNVYIYIYIYDLNKAQKKKRCELKIFNVQ
jgi:hypothetical protein